MTRLETIEFPKESWVATMPSGRCTMKGTCGSVGWMGQPLPCPYDGPAVQPDSVDFKEMLVATCGNSYADVPVCCTSEQVETLQANFKQTEPLISSCPACRNNFREFFCAFTCSSGQGTFLNVSSTQNSDTNQEAVKSVEFFVGSDLGQGFYDSCKDVKFGATNGYSMDFIGGGAKTYLEFFKYMGDVRPGLGSPFQINFPNETLPGYTQYNPKPRSCVDEDLSSRCACIDCPSTCPILPSIPSPTSQSPCHVGPLSCFSFILLMTYITCLIGFAGGYGLVAALGRRRRRGAIFLAGTDDTPSSELVGASSLATQHDDTVSDSRHSLGRGASLLDPEGLQSRQYRLNTILRRTFYRMGYLCAGSPIMVFIAALLFISIANLGWKFFDVEKDPVKLWIAPHSDSRIQKDMFDEHFGPFYRVEQIFVVSSVEHPPEHHPHDVQMEFQLDSALERRPVLSLDTLQWLLSIEDEIRSLRSPKSNLGLEDVCFKPAGPDGACVVQSVTMWLGGNLNKDTWLDRIRNCARQPGNCIPEYGQPLQPEYVLGAVPIQNGTSQWIDARSLVITYVVADSLDRAVRAKAEEWEEELLEYLQRLSRVAPYDQGLEIYFSTGVSLEEELNKSTNTDTRVAVLSYLAMLLYVSLTLGRGGNGDYKSGTSFFKTWFFKRTSPSSPATSASSFRGGHHPFRYFFIESKAILGLFGLTLVVVSITCSVGIWSYFGVKVTLIIAEVIPFLVLAVGVDNVFLLVAELERENSLHGHKMISPIPSANMATPLSPSQRYLYEQDPDDLDSGSAYLVAEERIARSLSKVGPSILLSSGSQTVAFALGALVPMPAVRNFALYAALSIFVNAAMQITVFVSALTLDLRRAESGRIDCFPCIKLPARIAPPDPSPSSGGTLTRFFRRTYVPFILHPIVKGTVIAIFSGIAVFSIISIQNIKLGLDQKLALPSDSYLVDYFGAVEKHLDVGPPVYFVVESLNMSTRLAQRSICGRFTTCDEFSVANTLEAERKRPEFSFISQPPAVWVDDFLKWLDPALDSCCRVKKSDPLAFCSPRQSERLCQSCLDGRDPPWNITMDGMPEGSEFNRYLMHWLESPTDEECPLGGEQSYRAAISLDEKGSVVASHFRTYHTPLRQQSDYINAYAAAHRIADDLSRKTGAKIFPYSVFYVFFEQYSRIISTTQEILGLGLASVLLLTSVLVGSWRAGTVVTGVVGLTILSVMGVMGVWNISLNAISLVNLVISLGIAVEFCSHIARGYMSSASGAMMDGIEGQKERDERVFNAMVDVGPSVLSGITFTKLIGISVLAFTRSKLLEIYFFRMWLSLILLGAFHGLLLLPVLLSLAGGPGYTLEDADEEWMSTAIRRHDYEYTPFSADNESIVSDL